MQCDTVFVGQIYSYGNITTALPSDPLETIYSKLLRTNTPNEMVMVLNSDEKLVGIVTASNITSMKKLGWYQTLQIVDDYADTHTPMASAVQYGREKGLTVSDVMTKDPITVTTQDTFYQALFILADKHKHRLPVVTEDGKVRGVFDQDSAMKVAAKYATEQLGVPGFSPVTRDPNENPLDSASNTRFIRECMSRFQIVTANPDDLLVTLYPKIIRANNPEGVILVMEGDKLVGLVTASNFTRKSYLGRDYAMLKVGGEVADANCPMTSAVQEEYDKEIKVSRIMTTSPVTISEETTLYDALKILCEKNFHRLPVVDGNKKPLGIFHQQDAMELAAFAASQA